MPRTKISEFSATPANNTDIDSINIAEGCAPSGINDAIRELMAQLKDFQTGAVGDSFNGPIGTSTAAAGAFTTLSASGTTTLSGLTASTALALDASKNVVSVTNTGTGSNVLATSPTLVTPALGTPSALVGTNITGTAASFNINGTVGATTANTGAFTTLAASGAVTLSGGTANGVTYLNGSKVLTSGSALTFDGTNLETTGRLVVRTTTSPSFAGQIGYSAFGGTYIWPKAGSDDNFSLYDGLGNSAYQIKGSYSHVWSVSGTEAMRLTSTSLYTASGINVGIGLSNPANKLTVKPSATSSGTLDVLTGSTNTDSVRISGGGTVNTWLEMRGYLGVKLYSDATNTVTVDSAGNLGLGIAPSAWNSGYKFLQFSDATGAFFGGSGYGLQLGSNAYINSSSVWVYGGGAYKAARYEQFDGAHKWFSSTASPVTGNNVVFSQAMTLDASGNLMVGGTTALNTASGRGNITIDGSSNSILNFGVGGTAKSYLFQNAGNFIIANLASAGGFLSFENNGAERARIDSSGNFCYGVQSFSAASNGFLVSADGSSTYTAHANGTSSGATYSFFYYNNSAIGSITQSGTTAVLYNTTSDQRLKENIQDADSASSLIDSLQVRKFDWKSDGTHQRYGFVAQELVTVAPEAVHQPTDTEQMMAVDYSKLVPMLVKEIQSLRQRVAQLETN